MTNLVRLIVDGYTELMYNKSDPRVNDWLLMSSPFPTLCICLSYAYFVKVIGPKWMENRKPFDLKNVIIVYNLFQVILSTWLFYEMARGCWWYYMSKFSEFMDTIFFVLRKKNRHISTLHVIHHGVMPMSVWFGVKFTPGGHSSFFGLLNTFVHIIMYSYYLLAALGPQMQKYLWWKKYLTALQMVQFVLVMLHAFQLLVVDCSYPKAFVWWIGLHAVMFYFLFSNFYKEAYVQRNKAQAMSNGATTNGKSRMPVNICFQTQAPLYETSDNVKDMKKSYTSSDGDAVLRNRVFIDSTKLKG